MLLMRNAAMKIHDNTMNMGIDDAIALANLSTMKHGNGNCCMYTPTELFLPV